ncbi:MAG: hypothetical protein Q8R56_15815, partial [Polaromonas sp.]|nr:hypothetical protein [Polaromonas sp.]
SIGTGSPNLLVYSLAPGAPTEPVIQVVAVKSLTGGATKLVNGWRAYATVTLRDINNTSAIVANATVQGRFSPGGTASCVTDSTSSCTMSSARINKHTGSTEMTVTGVSGSNLSYDSSQNSASQITIVKP